MAVAPPHVDDIRLRKRSVTERSAMDISEGICLLPLLLPLLSVSFRFVRFSSVLLLESPSNFCA